MIHRAAYRNSACSASPGISSLFPRLTGDIAILRHDPRGTIRLARSPLEQLGSLETQDAETRRPKGRPSFEPPKTTRLCAVMGVGSWPQKCAKSTIPKNALRTFAIPSNHGRVNGIGTSGGGDTISPASRRSINHRSSATWTPRREVAIGAEALARSRSVSFLLVRQKASPVFHRLRTAR